MAKKSNLRRGKTSAGRMRSTLIMREGSEKRGRGRPRSSETGRAAGKTASTGSRASSPVASKPSLEKKIAKGIKSPARKVTRGPGRPRGSKSKSQSIW